LRRFLKGTHFYSKLSVGEFGKENEIKIGDKILIIGATTGARKL
jgi:UPF0176 protein